MSKELKKNIQARNVLRVALYVRVSSQEQADEGYSIGEQTERLKKYAEAMGWEIHKIYVDPGYSGGNINRPGLNDMIKDVEAGEIDTVVVYKLDRLSRSQFDTLYLIEKIFLPNDTDFVSMTENFSTNSPLGRAMIGFLAVFAQLEREQIKERLSMGHIGRAKAGYWHGGSNVPIGYDFIDGKLVINEYEALQIRLIYKMFLDGETIHGISRYMNEHFKNKYSSYKDASQTGVILKNRLYIGKIKYKGQEYDGVHEPIIDEETFYRVQARYKEISSKWNENYRSPFKAKHLLTGIIFCGNCGARYFVWSSKSRKSGDRYAYYKCYSRDGNSTMKKIDGCRNPNYRVEKLDQIILDEIKKLKFNPNYLESLIESGRQTGGEDDTLRILEIALKEVESKINKLMDLYTLGSIPLDAIGDRLKPLYEEKEKIETQIQERKNETKIPEILSLKDTRDILDKYIAGIDTADHDTKRLLVQSLIKRIEVGTKPDTLKIFWKFV